MERFSHALKSRKYASRVAEDVDGADLSGVSGTPSFFINGVRHHGAYDLASLTEAIRAARARSMLRA
jgi:protein-disulfide isomerase